MTEHWNAPPPAGQPGTHAATPKRAWWKSVWFLVAVAAVIGIGIGAGSASDTGKTEAAKTQTVHATTTATATVDATVTEQPTTIKTIATRTHTRTETYTPPPKPAITDGTYKVGRDIKPGEWKTDGGGDCYWERDRNLDGGVDSIINNDNISGGALVQLEQGQYFKIDGGCEWRHS